MSARITKRNRMIAMVSGLPVFRAGGARQPAARLLAAHAVERSLQVLARVLRRKSWRVYIVEQNRQVAAAGSAAVGLGRASRIAGLGLLVRTAAVGVLARLP